MSEPTMWRTLKRAYERRGHLMRVENRAGLGTPDVNWCFGEREGWIELKRVARWPAHTDTLVRIPKYSPVQRHWIARRARAGGTVHVLLQVERPCTWLLFDAWAAVHVLGRADRARTLDAAVVVGLDAFPAAGILSVLLSKSSLAPYTSSTPT